MDKHNSEWMTGGSWYNKSICENLHGRVFEVFIKTQELTDIISCVILTQIEKNTNQLVIMAAAVGIVHYQQIQQQKHCFCSVQP